MRKLHVAQVHVLVLGRLHHTKDLVGRLKSWKMLTVNHLYHFAITPLALFEQSVAMPRTGVDVDDGIGAGFAHARDGTAFARIGSCEYLLNLVVFKQSCAVAYRSY